MRFPFKTRPEEEAKTVAALFVTLQPYKHALLQRTAWRDLSKQGFSKGMKEAVEKCIATTQQWQHLSGLGPADP